MKMASLILFLAFLAACGNSDTGDSPEMPPVLVVDSLPPRIAPMEFETYESLAPLFKNGSDTTYIVNFWATWCKPCVEELPYFESLHRDLQSQGAKAKVLLVSLDFPNQIDSKLIPFIEKNKIQSEVVILLDGNYNAWIDQVDPSWGGAIPVTLVIQGDKRLFINEQLKSYEDLQNRLKSYL